MTKSDTTSVRVIYQINHTTCSLVVASKKQKQALIFRKKRIMILFYCTCGKQGFFIGGEGSRLFISWKTLFTEWSF